jgi:16S rRNA (cytosine967-C5)-methyltransferase
MGPVTPRQIALAVLLKARSSKVFVDDLVDSTCPEDMPPRDRGLVTGIAFGVTRHRRTLDALIEKFAARSLERIHPTIAAILELSLFQLLFMERVPEYAVCNDAVNLARNVSAKSTAFVNAVLRSLLRDIDKKRVYVSPDSDREIEIEDGRGVRFKSPWLKAKDDPTRLGLRYSYPNFLTGRWLKQWGDEAAIQICRDGNRALPLTARVNRRKATREAVLDHLKTQGMAARKGGLPFSIHLEQGGALGRLPSFLNGEFTIQDETSMTIVESADIDGAPDVLDLCASPGGKATHVAELAPQARILANDISWARARKIDEARRRLGSERLYVLASDGRSISFRNRFDWILLDAPCSNTGVLARRPDARWRITARELARLSRLQSELIENAARCLKRGGRILYSTCSIEPEENEQTVQRFLQSRPDFRLGATKVIPPSRNAGGGFYAHLEWPND